MKKQSSTMTTNKYPLLDKINIPKDLRKLKTEQLEQACSELRNFIIETVSQNPGHLGSNLGVVELTVALHYVLDTPYDKLVWDVGHQAYGHKILTGRKNIFHTNRKFKGLSGFPKPGESKYDAFGVGHSSTSISAALGIAIAGKYKKEKERKTVAIIGDGAMTAGLAFEGLNNGAEMNPNILVILNDNNMSIDPNTGGVNRYLLDTVTSTTYNKVKQDVWNTLGRLRKFGANTQELVKKINQGIKSILLKQSNIFEAFDFRYFGPVDGHNVTQLVKVLDDLSKIDGPKVLHVLTQKGKGMKQAEINQTYWHAPGKFDKNTGEIFKTTTKLIHPPKYQDVFGNTIVELAEKNKKIIGITPAMLTGSSLNIMQKKMPDRVFDTGIAEQHAVTFSAGLAIEGMLPFCNIYSSFMQRAYDQVIHDVAIQNLNVIFCLDRGGLVGSDGPTHHGAFDLAFMRIIPNMIVSAPMDEMELRNLMFTAQQKNRGPFSIRYPRGPGVTIDWQQKMKSLSIGTGRRINEGVDLAILTIGHIGNITKQAVKKIENEGISAAHYDMRFLKPIDEKLLHEVFKKFNSVITVEDGCITGGLGSAVLEFINDHHYNATVKRLGIPDQFIEHGTQEELYKECNYNEDAIVETAKKLMKIKTF